MSRLLAVAVLACLLLGGCPVRDAISDYSRESINTRNSKLLARDYSLRSLTLEAPLPNIHYEPDATFIRSARWSADDWQICLHQEDGAIGICSCVGGKPGGKLATNAQQDAYTEATYMGSVWFDDGGNPRWKYQYVPATPEEHPTLTLEQQEAVKQTALLREIAANTRRTP
jgi:hypothetical protein